MKTKCISLRFNLTNDDDSKAWESLQSSPGIKNKIIIDALNEYFAPKENISEVICQTIRECLSTVTLPEPAGPGKEPVTADDDEAAIMDAMADFIG